MQHQRVQALDRVVLLLPHDLVAIKGVAREIAPQLRLEQRRAVLEEGIELAELLEARAHQRLRRDVGRRVGLDFDRFGLRKLRFLVHDLELVCLRLSIVNGNVEAPGGLEGHARVVGRVGEVEFELWHGGFVVCGQRQ